MCCGPTLPKTKWLPSSILGLAQAHQARSTISSMTRANERSKWILSFSTYEVTRWNNFVPKRLKVFLGLRKIVFLLGLISALRASISTPQCAVCDENQETSHHKFQECKIAKDVWVLMPNGGACTHSPTPLRTPFFFPHIPLLRLPARGYLIWWFERPYGLYGVIGMRSTSAIKLKKSWCDLWRYYDISNPLFGSPIGSRIAILIGSNGCATQIVSM